MSSTILPVGPRRSWSTSRTMLVVGVVSVAVLLVAVLAAGLGGSGGGAAAPGNPVTSSAAERAGGESAPSPPWLLALVLGLDLWNSTTLPLNTSSAPANCTLSPPPELLPRSLTIPSFRGNLSTGAAVFWILEYVAPSTNSSMVVLVTNGVARPLYTLSGPACVTVYAGFAGLPTDLVDSGVAAQAVDQNGGAQYLAAHRTGTSLEMLLLSSLATPEWEFGYTQCSLLGLPQTGPKSAFDFDASVNAITGAVLNASPETVDCQQNVTGPPPNTIYSALSPGVPEPVKGSGTGGTIASQGCTSGDYCYELPVGNATAEVTPADFELYVSNASGRTSSVPVGYAVLNPEGQVVVYSLGAEESTWTPGVGNASTPISPGSSIWVDMGTADPSGLNYELNVQGEGPYANSGAGFSLP